VSKNDAGYSKNFRRPVRLGVLDNALEVQHKALKEELRLRLEEELVD